MADFVVHPVNEYANINYNTDVTILHIKNYQIKYKVKKTYLLTG